MSRQFNKGTKTVEPNPYDPRNTELFPNAINELIETMNTFKSESNELPFPVKDFYTNYIKMRDQLIKLMKLRGLGKLNKETMKNMDYAIALLKETLMEIADASKKVVEHQAIRDLYFHGREGQTNNISFLERQIRYLKDAETLSVGDNKELIKTQITSFEQMLKNVEKERDARIAAHEKTDAYKEAKKEAKKVMDAHVEFRRDPKTKRTDDEIALINEKAGLIQTKKATVTSHNQPAATPAPAVTIPKADPPPAAPRHVAPGQRSAKQAATAPITAQPVAPTQAKSQPAPAPQQAPAKTSVTTAEAAAHATPVKPVPVVPAQSKPSVAAGPGTPQGQTNAPSKLATSATVHSAQSAVRSEKALTSPQPPKQQGQQLPKKQDQNAESEELRERASKEITDLLTTLSKIETKLKSTLRKRHDEPDIKRRIRMGLRELQRDISSLREIQQNIDNSSGRPEGIAKTDLLFIDAANENVFSFAKDVDTWATVVDFIVDNNKAKRNAGKADDNSEAMALKSYNEMLKKYPKYQSVTEKIHKATAAFEKILMAGLKGKDIDNFLKKPEKDLDPALQAAISKDPKLAEGLNTIKEIYKENRDIVNNAFLTAKKLRSVIGAKAVAAVEQRRQAQPTPPAAQKPSPPPRVIGPAPPLPPRPPEREADQAISVSQKSQVKIQPQVAEPKTPRPEQNQPSRIQPALNQTNPTQPVPVQSQAQRTVESAKVVQHKAELPKADSPRRMEPEKALASQIQRTEAPPQQGSRIAALKAQLQQQGLPTGGAPLIVNQRNAADAKARATNKQQRAAENTNAQSVPIIPSVSQPKPREDDGTKRKGTLGSGPR